MKTTQSIKGYYILTFEMGKNDVRKEGEKIRLKQHKECITVFTVFIAFSDGNFKCTWAFLSSNKTSITNKKRSFYAKVSVLFMIWRCTFPSRHLFVVFVSFNISHGIANYRFLCVVHNKKAYNKIKDRRSKMRCDYTWCHYCWLHLMSLLHHVFKIL